MRKLPGLIRAIVRIRLTITDMEEDIVFPEVLGTIGKDFTGIEERKGRHVGDKNPPHPSRGFNFSHTHYPPNPSVHGLFMTIQTWFRTSILDVWDDWKKRKPESVSTSV
jgi:hypothetical protein